MLTLSMLGSQHCQFAFKILCTVTHRPAALFLLDNQKRRLTCRFSRLKPKKLLTGQCDSGVKKQFLKIAAVNPCPSQWPPCQFGHNDLPRPNATVKSYNCSPGGWKLQCNAILLTSMFRVQHMTGHYFYYLTMLAATTANRDLDVLEVCIQCLQKRAPPRPCSICLDCDVQPLLPNHGLLAVSQVANRSEDMDDSSVLQAIKFCDLFCSWSPSFCSYCMAVACKVVQVAYMQIWQATYVVSQLV